MTQKIAILHYAGPPVVGGVESTIYHHARLLSGMGWDVRVIAGRGEAFSPEIKFHQLLEIDSRHPEVLRIGKELAEGSVPPGFAVLRDHLFEQLTPILAGIRVCVVHNALTLHKNMPLTAALHLLNERKEIPLIAWCHDFAWQDELYLPALHPGYPWDLLRTPWPDVRYVAVSEDRRTRLANLLGLPVDRIQVITPGIDPREITKLGSLTWQLVEKLDLLRSEPLLLLPARITRRKNIQFAIRVTGSLKGMMPHPVLLVTGPPGPHNPKNAAYLQSLKQLRGELGLEQQVHFLFEHGEAGQPLHLPDSAIADLYRLADALLFPSLREGFGIPVLEAGLARLPVFAADIPPVRESSGDLAALFDPRGEPGMVAGKIADYLEADRAYLLRKRVLDHFTWQSILENKLLPVLRGAAGEDLAPGC